MNTDEPMNNRTFVKKFFGFLWDKVNEDSNGNEEKKEKESPQVVETTGEEIK